MKTIKRVIRKNFAETNSSSSHSLIIDTTDYDNSDAFKLNRDSKGNIIIEKKYFNWGWYKTNNVNEKLSYVFAQIYANYGSKISKKINQVRRIVLKFTGAPGIVYNADSVFDEFNIDHQSTDLIKQIMESNSSIKDFIFNPKSWLYIGDDNEDPPSRFYSKESEPDYYLSVYFPDPIGRLDMDFYSMDDISIKNVLYNLDENLLTDIVINVKKGYKVEWYSNYVNRDKYSLDSIDMTRIPNFLYYYNICIDNKIYWISRDLIKLIGTDRENEEKCLDLINKYPFHARSFNADIFSTEFNIIL